jgi:hypothetical protein
MRLAPRNPLLRRNLSSTDFLELVRDYFPIFHWCANKSVKEREQSPVEKIFLMNDSFALQRLTSSALTCNGARDYSTADL